MKCRAGWECVIKWQGCGHLRAGVKNDSEFGGGWTFFGYPMHREIILLNGGIKFLERDYLGVAKV